MEPESSSREHRVFLLGGTGWMRRVSALEEGRRYIPKGGHLVDFATRTAVVRKNTRTSTQEEKVRIDNKDKASADFSPARAKVEGKRAVPPPQTAKEQPALQQTNLNKVFLFAPQKQDDNAQINQSNNIPCAVEQLNNNNPATLRKWRPPGISSGLGPRQCTVAGAMQSAQRRGKKKSQQPAHDCQNCRCCTDLRHQLETEAAAARQERAAAVQMRRRLEASLDKAAKEEAQFQKYKESETARIEGAMAESKRKLQRDRLAEEARTRAAAKDSVQQIKEDLATLQAQLHVERRDAGRSETKHKMEAERLRWQIRRLERENKELKEGLETVEADRIKAWAAHQATKQHNILHTSPSPRTREAEEAPSVDAGSQASTPKSAMYRWVAQTESCLVHSSSPGCRSLLYSINASPEFPGEDWAAAPSIHIPDGSGEQYTSTGSSSSGGPEPIQALQPSATLKASNMAPSECCGAIFSTKDGCIAGAVAREASRSSAPEVTHFPNGSVRRQWPDGHSVTLYTNGDVKQEYPSGIVEYFYKEVECWQVTGYPSGIETFYFPGGKIEAHLPNGAKEIVMMTGEGGAVASRILPGGSRTVTVPPTLVSQEIFQPMPVFFDRVKTERGLLSFS